MKLEVNAIESAALRTIDDAVDAITTKATQLQSLLVLLLHTAGLEDLPAQHRENVYWLASELAAEIRAAAEAIG